MRQSLLKKGDSKHKFSIKSVHYVRLGKVWENFGNLFARGSDVDIILYSIILKL